MKDGTLTRRGKVVYRSKRNLRDRERHVFRPADLIRIGKKVLPQIDGSLVVGDLDPSTGIRDVSPLVADLQYLAHHSIEALRTMSLHVGASAEAIAFKLLQTGVKNQTENLYKMAFNFLNDIVTEDPSGNSETD